MAQLIDETSKKENAKESSAPKARKRKGVDKWKTKKWFNVMAPAAFNNSVLAQTPGEEPEGLMGRTVMVSAREITGNIKKSTMMLRFKVNNVQGLNAYTRFDSVEVQPGSVRRLVRRRTSKIESVDDVMCKDGVQARIKSVALCTHKVSAPRRTDIRRILRDEVKSMAAGQDYEALLNQVVTGDPTSGFMGKARKIAPLKRVDILKVTRLTA